MRAEEDQYLSPALLASNVQRAAKGEFVGMDFKYSHGGKTARDIQRAIGRTGIHQHDLGIAKALRMETGQGRAEQSLFILCPHHDRDRRPGTRPGLKDVPHQRHLCRYNLNGSPLSSVLNDSPSSLAALPSTAVFYRRARRLAIYVCVI